MDMTWCINGCGVSMDMTWCSTWYDRECEWIWRGVALEMTASVNWYSLFSSEVISWFVRMCTLRLLEARSKMRMSCLYCTCTHIRWQTQVITLRLLEARSKMRISIDPACVCHVTLSHLYYDAFICDMTHLCGTWLVMWHDCFILDMSDASVTSFLHLPHQSCICPTNLPSVTWMCAVKQMCPLSQSRCPLSQSMCPLSHQCTLFHMNVRSVTCICTSLAYVSVTERKNESDMSHVFVTWPMYLSHESCIRDMSHVCVTWVMYLSHESCICHMNVRSVT